MRVVPTDRARLGGYEWVGCRRLGEVAERIAARKSLHARPALAGLVSGRLGKHHEQQPLYAQFPPLKDLPDAAHEPIEALMALRTRKADVQTRRSEAHQELEAARRADALALKDHVAAGGSSSTFQGSAQSVEQDIRHLDADLRAIDQLLREQYVRTCEALQAVADEGAELAQRNTSNAQTRYENAINELEAARQSYLASCGVELF
jgi:hypothetical protein